VYDITLAFVLCQQIFERILNVMKTNKMRIVITIPMKYGVEFCEFGVIELSVNSASKAEKSKKIMTPKNTSEVKCV